MTDTVVSSPAPVASSPAAKKSPSKKKTAAPKGTAAKKATPSHPSTSIMVTSAIKELKERKGSSLPAIKKYLAANYQVDPAKLAPFIRKFLKAAVANGTIVQTAGTGASGHFKLAVVEAKPKKTVVAKKPVAKKVKPAAPTPKKKKPTAAKKAKSATGEPAAKKVKKSVAKSPKTVTVVKPKKAAKGAKVGKLKTPKKATSTKKPVNPKKK